MPVVPFIQTIEKLGVADDPSDLFFEPPVRDRPVFIDLVSARVNGDPNKPIQIGVKNGLYSAVLCGAMMNDTGQVLTLGTTFPLDGGYSVFMRCLFNSAAYTRTMVVVGHYFTPD